MKIRHIKNIIRKDVPIYYRRLFSGIAELELLDKPVELAIDFTIETKPTGHKQISVTAADTVDYPLVPLIRDLKNHINDLDENGGLPG
ncbi:MAG: hypothetical protein LBP93_00350 [Treponema sp.]|jgi:hypothetical protein|nr:hypothetical protein [Treponema sp.]